MYSAVNTNDYNECYTDVEMDDRESLYFDTISVAGSEPNRKSLSMSRQTIYHSAVDLPAYEAVVGTPKRESNQNSHKNSNNNTANSNPKALMFSRQSTILDVGDYRDITPGGYDEVSDRLIDNSKQVSFHGEEKYISLQLLAKRRSGSLNLTHQRLPKILSESNDSGNMGNCNCRESIDELLQVIQHCPINSWRRFQDGERSVDFVLAYKGEDTNPQNHVKRQMFEGNLEREGLELEREKTQKIHFVKIHAPIEILCRYCEILKIKLPIKKVREQESIPVGEFQLMQEMKSFFGKPFQFVKLDEKLFPPREYTLMFEYSRQYDYLFDTEDPNFFDSSVRSAVIKFILERQRYCNEGEGDNVGIDNLLAHNVYDSAYPLHDGDCDSVGSQRNLLLNEWASLNKWIKHQPLDNIKDYFGVKIAMYFAWLGFYAHMLIPAALVGVICFFYGLATLGSDSLSQDICNENNTIIMCPQCDVKCDYWYLKETCTYSKANYLIDNDVTVYFAFFMSFWAILYLELWKRYSANLMHRWGLTDYCHKAEHPRPQYLERLRGLKDTTTKFNVIHRVLEPHVPYWKTKFPMYVVSFSTAFLFVCVAVAAVFALVVYRMSQSTSHNIYGNTDTMSYKIMVLPATAAVIDLIVITILNYAYDYLAVFLTNLEYCRTQTEYDESLTLKIYLFQFVNYYSAIFYIAFLKGKFVGYPAKYNRIFNLRQEECGPGGCLMELCIQLVIIMIGKQIINAILEMLIPYLTKSYKQFSQRVGLLRKDSKDKLVSCNQWTEDYKLLAWTQRGLFDEYLEMIIQYGFITIFVVAFPLAPLFALINNVLEMRLDAKKFLKFYRRPVAQRVKDIGVWYNIMAIIGKITVVSSALIIAFSSNLIPKLVYRLTISLDKTDTGYMQHTLAYFDTKDFQSGPPAHSAFSNVTMCRYPEYRNPPSADDPYKRPIFYWRVLSTRLAFIVIFQNVVGFVQMLVAWIIPDMPGKLRNMIKKEEYLTQQIIIEQEKRRLQTKIVGDPVWVPTNTNNIENGSPLTEVELRDDNGDIEFRRRRANKDAVDLQTTCL